MLFVLPILFHFKISIKGYTVIWNLKQDLNKEKNFVGPVFALFIREVSCHWLREFQTLHIWKQWQFVGHTYARTERQDTPPWRATQGRNSIPECKKQTSHYQENGMSLVPWEGRLTYLNNSECCQGTDRELCLSMWWGGFLGIKFLSTGAEAEVACRMAPGAPSQDSLIPKHTYFWTLILQQCVIPVPGDLIPSSSLHRYPHTWHTHIQTYTNTHK